jgi:hypothetical protein
MTTTPSQISIGGHELRQRSDSDQVDHVINVHTQRHLHATLAPHDGRSPNTLSVKLSDNRPEHRRTHAYDIDRCAQLSTEVRQGQDTMIIL